MAIEMKEAGVESGISNNIDGTDIWYDDEGVGWDIDYVARYETLRASLQGTLICAWDKAYEEARVVWTGATDCWPAAMVFCMGAADLEACLTFALDYDLALSVRDQDQAFATPAVVNGAIVIDTTLL